MKYLTREHEPTDETKSLPATSIRSQLHIRFTTSINPYWSKHILVFFSFLTPLLRRGWERLYPSPSERLGEALTPLLWRGWERFLICLTPPIGEDGRGQKGYERSDEDGNDRIIIDEKWKVPSGRYYGRLNIDKNIKAPSGRHYLYYQTTLFFTNNELPELPEMISVISEIRSLIESSVGTTLW